MEKALANNYTFYESYSKNTHIIQLDNGLKDSKATVKHIVMTQMKHTLQHT